MNKRTKTILSVIGLSAIIIPAILLIVATRGAQKEPEISSSSRQIDTQTIEDAVNKSGQRTIEIVSPNVSTPSASPNGGTNLQGTPSAGP